MWGLCAGGHEVGVRVEPKAIEAKRTDAAPALHQPLIRQHSEPRSPRPLPILTTRYAAAHMTLVIFSRPPAPKAVILVGVS